MVIVIKEINSDVSLLVWNVSSVFDGGKITGQFDLLGNQRTEHPIFSEITRRIHFS